MTNKNIYKVTDTLLLILLPCYIFKNQILSFSLNELINSRIIADLLINFTKALPIIIFCLISCSIIFRIVSFRLVTSDSENSESTVNSDDTESNHTKLDLDNNDGDENKKDYSASNKYFIMLVPIVIASWLIYIILTSSAYRPSGRIALGVLAILSIGWFVYAYTNHKSKTVGSKHAHSPVRQAILTVLFLFLIISVFAGIIIVGAVGCWAGNGLGDSSCAKGTLQIMLGGILLIGLLLAGYIQLIRH